MNPAADTPCEKLPVAVGGALAFSKIAPGPQHSCGVTTDGRLFCWGDNSAAQLGLGTIDGLVHSAPVKASLGALSGATFRDVGVSLFTCALTTTGAVWCWGGAFGTAPTSPVSGALRFASLSVGAVHACGVTTAGIGYCWGPTTDANSYGQFGSGSTHYSFTPAPIANRAVQ
jgi:alpha-tubulin suppressor-like RCC1 family protein